MRPKRFPSALARACPDSVRSISKVFLELRYRCDDSHSHLTSRACQIDTTQRQAVNTDAHFIKPLDRRLNIDGVAPQTIQLRHHEHVVALQPIEQPLETRTLLALTTRPSWALAA